MPKILYDVTLRGASMSEVDDAIIIRDIVEMQPTEDRHDTKRAMHAGTRAASVIRRTLPIKVVYVIREYDSTKRAEIMGKIVQWVGTGGELTISTRPGKRLFVKPDKTPHLESSLKWTEDLELTLTAYEQPYWEDAAETTNPKSDSGSAYVNSVWSEAHQKYVAATVIDVPGNVEKVPVCVSFYGNGDDPVTHIKLVADDTFFELEGIEVGPGMFGGLVMIDYDNESTMFDTLRIYDIYNDVSLLAKRTAESNDDLLVRCGHTNQLYAYADAPVAVTFSTRGRWL